MTKEELLGELLTKINAGEVTKEEVVTKLSLPVTSPALVGTDGKATASFSVTSLLYVFGAAVAVIGIVIFIAQIWEDLGSFARIIITLGLGLLVTAIGSVLQKQKPNDNIGAIFHFMGGVLVPGGALVTLSELGLQIDSVWPTTITFGLIFAFYLALNYIHKHPLLTLFAIANGTAFVYLLVGAIDDFNSDHLYLYLTMIIGSSYLLLAHSFQDGWNSKLLGALHFFGIAGIMGAGFARVIDSGFWELFYFILVFAGLYLSIYLRSRIVLVISTLALIVHVSYLTGVYFADSLGWPISLILLGFVIIGLGFSSVRINKTYIKQG